MYQDINIKNPIFLSSFIFIILSLLLLYRKQNYFAKVQIWNLQSWLLVPKTAVFGTDYTSPWIFVPKQADFGTFLRSYPEKFLPGSTFARRIVRTASAAHAAMHSIISFRTLFNCDLRVNIALHIQEVEKWQSVKKSAKVSQIFCKLIFFNYPSTCRGRKRAKSEKHCKTFTKLLQKSWFLILPHM